ncbi:MAG: MFS transporter [Bacteroidales bacterium]|nr:MFS transporter [Bacteroidales bacterium]
MVSDIVKKKHAWLPWAALACLVVPMFASYYFDDMFSSISYLFENPSLTALGWDSAGYGLYASGYSVLCVFGGLVIGGILLDKWGVRVSGSLFVGMMVLGAGLVTFALLYGGSSALTVAYVGVMLFGLGSEIAGTAVTRSIAKWFRGGPMALAMGLQLAIARLGTAFALVLSPRLVQQIDGHVYSLGETARPALVGMALMALGLILWGIFVAIDARHSASSRQTDPSSSTTDPTSSTTDPTSRQTGCSSSHSGLDPESPSSSEDTFRFKDVLGVLGNRNFWLLGLLCVLFYSSIIAFKKFAGAILIPRFDIPAQTAGWMVSMLPFSTVIFAPLFGMLVDKAGRGTRWMVLGAVLALIAHLLLAFAPQGVPFWGYLAMVFLGFGYSLVPAALWPSVPKIVPDKVLGTTFALIYWVQNLGLMSFKWIAGVILGRSGASAAASAGVSVTAAASSAASAGVSVTAGASSAAAAGATAPAASSWLTGPVSVELMFVALCVAALFTALVFARISSRNPHLRLDSPNS